jgi:hypothetical protein
MNRNRFPVLAMLAAALAACGGHLGDLGPRAPVRPPILPPAATPQTGLVSLCGGNDEIRADYVLPNAGFEAALFVEHTGAEVFTNPPVLTGLTGSSVILTAASNPGLIANGTQVFAGFGIRRTGTTPWTPIGTVIRCRPSVRTVFVDPAGPPDGNGSSPANAFPLLDNALLVGAVFASAFGDVNVWVLEGTYTTRAFNPATQEGGAFTVGPGVHVYGGFQPGFALADRRATGRGSILHGGPTTRVVDVIGGAPVHVVDGFFIDGRDTTTEGMDIVESDCEVRSVASQRCVDNGVRIKQLVDFTNRRNVTLVACDVSQNLDDGLGVTGVFQVTFDRSTFDANGGAGIDVNDLLALEGSSASLRAFGCRFFGNSIEGLAMDLNTIATANQTPGGRFNIDVEACTFERNGTNGLDIDQDHDLFPAWHASVRVRDCIARANRQHGMHVDADDQGDYVYDRVRCTANGGDGFLVTSDVDDPTTTADDQAPGHIAVTNSYCGGNQGAGMRASQGDKVLFVSHCALAGNRGGGIVSELTASTGNNPRRISSAVSTVFWRQPDPLTNVVQEACWFENVLNPFSVAPEVFATATANNAGALTLDAGAPIVAGQTVVLGDDGVARSVGSASGNVIVVAPAPTTFVAPDGVFGYADATITDDLRLLVNSPAKGTGLVPAGAPPVDPGPWGSIGGGEPGVFDPFTPPVLHLLQTTPPSATGVTPTTPMVLTFDRALDVTSVTPDRVRVVGVSGIGISVLNDQLTVSPPTSGWPGGDVLELNIGIAAQDGTQFGTPLLIPILIR